MNLNIGQVSLSDLLGMLDRKELVINRNYQRGADIWPSSARSYFIDTILQDYPFPKIYFYQSFNEATGRPFKELVDGQQRVTTILDFANNKFALGSASKKFAGRKFRDLDEETKRVFLSYQIEHSTILAATRAELLEMFRRMNAYTAPLKEAEKRHSTYQGEFKWFVAELADVYSPALDIYEVLTEKQISRMADAEFVSELILVLESGVQTKRNATIEKLYRDNDEQFPKRDLYYDILIDFWNLMFLHFSAAKGTYLFKSYVVHSLFCAYAAIKYSYPGSEIFFDAPDVNYKFDFEAALPRLLALAEAHENQEDEGEFRVYVEACSSSTTQLVQRRVRTKFMVEALVG